MIGLTAQWTILERLEWESLQAEIRALDPAVAAGDAGAWEQAKPLLERVRELVKAAHRRAGRPAVMVQGGSDR